ncbi:synaptonemal complex central element protein 1-like isoform X2 [Mauremys mutica]|uniref:synaptonemal complex central element protein 1-like isoform X2 n=1 Tax=Mauremys mutica TaxID=74926 RepID=UPI001D168FF9|nr:synaptonemal complex central element protein 1-like isoform X2 [Mauremys mutica]
MLRVPSDFAPKAEELLLLVKQLQDAGTLEPRMDDLVGRISRLQRAKQNLSQELHDGQVRSEELQAELEERTKDLIRFGPRHLLSSLAAGSFAARATSLPRCMLGGDPPPSAELLRTLQLRCQETEAEAQRQQTLSQERKQSIEELTAKIQEEKLKQRKQSPSAPVVSRLEFEQQLDELMEKHKSLQEGHSMEKLAAEIGSMAESKERLLSEDKLIQDNLAQVEKQLGSLPQAEAAPSQERMFLKSQEASTALQLFQQENKRATEYLEAASRRHSELQQKFKRLRAELEAQQGSRGDSASMETDA